MSTTLQPNGLEALQAQALELAVVVEQLTDWDINELHAAVLERVGRGSDLQGLPRRLRPLLNRILDVLDRSSLAAREVALLTQIVFS
jgi:hypothetical protein